MTGHPPSWSRRWAPTGPVLLAPPVGSAAFHASGCDLVVDGARVWELGADVARAWQVAGVRQAVFEGPDVRLETPIWIVRLGAGGPTRTTWEAGVEVRGLRLVLVDGVMVVGDRALDVVDGAERCSIGPRGELAVVGARGLRIAPRGRTPVETGLEVDPDSLRWSPDGRSVTIRAAVGWVRVDTTTRAVRRARPRAWIPEASCAVSGTFVAGPAGLVWDLRNGSAVPGATVALGATVAVGRSFVTVSWETHRGSWLDPTGGAVTTRFRLPLGDDDLVVGGARDDGAALLWSAEGRCFRVRGARVEEIDGDGDPPDPVTQVLETPAGTFEADGALALDGRRWAWSGTGGLLGWPLGSESTNQS